MSFEPMTEEDVAYMNRLGEYIKNKPALEQLYEMVRACRARWSRALTPSARQWAKENADTASYWSRREGIEERRYIMEKYWEDNPYNDNPNDSPSA